MNSLGGALSVFVGSRAVPEAHPKRLWRKNNQAAVFDFVVPRKALLQSRDTYLTLRQGSLCEACYGIGASSKRVFYGALPAQGADINLSENNRLITFTATDFIGQLESRSITIGDSASSYLNPVGQEIGGVVAGLVADTIGAQYGGVAFSVNGVQGTRPTQIIGDADLNAGAMTARKALDDFTKLAVDDSAFPDPPLLYEYHQRDEVFVWRKHLSTASGTPAMNIVIGKDAVLGGTVRRAALNTDAIAVGKGDAYWSHADRDSSRRWGGRRFVSTVSTTSSFLSDAYDLATRTVELNKSERISFSLEMLREAWFLYPGDLVFVQAGADHGIVDGSYRVTEVQTVLAPSPKTTIGVDVSGARLTDYL